MLNIYNTLTRKKEPLKTIEPGKVGLYVCGMTVYDFCHIGHARVMVVFDVVASYLRASGYDVNYVRNITDIDDKIIARANENGESITELTERCITYMNEDADALGVKRPDQEPKATEHVDDIIRMIETLIKNKKAYPAANGDVYYDISEFAEYGKLSGKNVDDLRVGERVAVDEAKDDPMDFVLWKAAKPDEPSWESPWGNGRPGWHIECSAMSICQLGNNFDIHGGGQDLQFPHHENEIAQSEGATGEPFANLWMHNGFVRVDDEKMSKSLGNFFTIRDVLEQYPAEVIRYFILTSHYRSPLNYSNEHLDNAKSALTRLYTALRGVEITETSEESEYEAAFKSAMDDDFNTPNALSVLFDLARDLNANREDPEKSTELACRLKSLGGLLGLLGNDPEDFLRGENDQKEGALSSDQIESYVQQRITAREQKDWSESDRIRDLLNEQDIILEDNAQGTSWRRK
ncbi:MAG: cysteine--tRNA ligase [Gammaproteobacteria bacterium]